MTINARRVEQWNLAVPVGTAVTLLKDTEEVIHTRTREKAYVLEGHTAVTWVEQVTGCYLLTRVRPSYRFQAGDRVEVYENGGWTPGEVVWVGPLGSRISVQCWQKMGVYKFFDASRREHGIWVLKGERKLSLNVVRPQPLLTVYP